MSRNMTPDGENEAETSVVEVRTTDLSEFEEGEQIRVHYRDEPTEPSETVTGEISMFYTDRKVLMESEDGTDLIVDLRDTASEGGLREFDSGTVVGRPMFAETAYHVEKDGHDLREELLGEDDDEDDTDISHVLTYENRLHGADETGAEYTRVSDISVRGYVEDDDEDAILFVGVECEDAAGGTGPFRVTSEGVVYRVRDEEENYEVGDAATVVEVEG